AVRPLGGRGDRRPMASSIRIGGHTVSEREFDVVIGLALEAEAAADDLFHDLGGAAEYRLHAAVGPGPACGVLAHVAVAAVQRLATRLHSSVFHHLTTAASSLVRVYPAGSGSRGLRVEEAAGVL